MLYWDVTTLAAVTPGDPEPYALNLKLLNLNLQP